MPAYQKWLWSFFLVFHLLMMTVSICKKTLKDTPVYPVVDYLRDFTDPYQWTFGLHQNWPMFAPDPRRETAWLKVRGKRASDGSYVDVPMRHGRPDPEGIIWLYDRSGKFERNATSKKRDHLRASIVRHVCRTFPETLQAVEISKVSQRTLAPGKNDKPRSEWPVRSTVLEEWRCKGF